MKAQLVGADAMIRALTRHGDKLAKAFEKGITKASKVLFEEAKQETPVDTGALLASGVQYTEGTGWKTVAIVGFGTPVRGFFKNGRERHPEEYACWQHDDPYNRKWLEITVDAEYDNIHDIVYTYLAKA